MAKNDNTLMYLGIAAAVYFLFLRPQAQQTATLNYTLDGGGIRPTMEGSQGGGGGDYRTGAPGGAPTVPAGYWGGGSRLPITPKPPDYAPPASPGDHYPMYPDGVNTGIF